jgi:hypothetical protein
LPRDLSGSLNRKPGEVFTQATLRRDVVVRQSKNADGVVLDWNTTSCNTQILGRFLLRAMFGIANALIAVKQALRSWSTARLERMPIGRRVKGYRLGGAIAWLLRRYLSVMVGPDLSPVEWRRLSFE